MNGDLVWASNNGDSVVVFLLFLIKAYFLSEAKLLSTRCT